MSTLGQYPLGLLGPALALIDSSPRGRHIAAEGPRARRGGLKFVQYAPRRMRKPAAILERYVLAALCAVAALRVLAFSAAFPLFNNSDERLHFDVVSKAASGRLPRGLEPLGREAALLGVVYGSPEFRYAPEFFEGGAVPEPLWRLDPEALSGVIEKRVPPWESRPNMEATQPPLYYLVSGIWCRLGRSLGLHEADAAYWVRFLNAGICASLVWLPWFGLRRMGRGGVARPDSWFCLGLPALLCVFPQNGFYGINNDVMSPLFFGAAFFCLLEAAASSDKGLSFYLAAGLLSGAAVLVKLTNAPVLAVAASVLVVKARAARRGKGGRDFRGACWMAAAAVGVIGLWSAWNWFRAGDLLGGGGALKAQFLGWTRRPPSVWMRHPLLTFRGMRHFTQAFLETFWRGELIWHGAPLAHPIMDRVYSASSALFLSAAGLELWLGKNRLDRSERCARLLSFAAFGVSVLFLAGLSFAYEFPDRSDAFPTRELPFMCAGRLALGALIPFLFLYLRGLCACCRVLRVSRTLLLGALAAGMIGSELFLMRPVFRSRYNWFHLPSGPILQTEAMRFQNSAAE